MPRDTLLVFPPYLQFSEYDPPPFTDKETGPSIIISTFAIT